jgi:hypothetical protein
MGLEQEFEWYVEHQAELVSQFGLKVLVIKDRHVIGVYDSEATAIEETRKEHEPGTFLVQRCGPGEENFTRIFRSRIAFC